MKLRTIGVSVSLVVLTAGTFVATRVLAQSPAAPDDGPPLTFEVASVKPNKSGDGRMMIGMQPGGRYTATNLPLRALIRQAYQLQDFQIVGGPGWVASERFDVIAKAEGELPGPGRGGGAPGPPPALQMMLRSLLAERFKLKVHDETREMPVYALVKARSDGKLGSQLRDAATDCDALIAAARGRGAQQQAMPSFNEPMQCGLRIGPGQMSGGGVALAQLAQTLSQFVQRVVIDRSGLTGRYDFDLTWTPDQMPSGPPPPGAPPLPPVDPNGPSIYTALQEQLGLKLDAQRGPVPVLVIDQVDQLIPD
jgi:uncharacterized protein (TIGR03435 family)